MTETHLRQVEERLAQNEALTAAITRSLGEGVYALDSTGAVTYLNPMAEALLGWTTAELLGRNMHEAIHFQHADGTPHPAESCPLARTWQELEPVRVHDDVFTRKDGSLLPVAYSSAPIVLDGRLAGIAVSFRDISEVKAATEQARDEARLVATLQDVGVSLVAELDLQRVLQKVTDAGTSLTGAEFGAFFYNVVAPRQESYMLYTVAGVDPEAFAGFAMPRNTAIFSPTFAGERVVRFDDVTASEDFGKNPPYFGMPEGHLPVRSYLAVPVRSRSGDVIGGLFFGHADAGVFTARHDRLIVGIAGQAAIAVDNARLYEAERDARATAERTAQQLARLQTATARLSGILHAADVAEVVAQEAAQGTGAAAALLATVEAGGESLRVVHAIGYPAEMLRQWEQFPLDAPLPAGDALRSRDVVLLGSLAERDERYPVFAGTPAQNQAHAIVPLVHEDRPEGIISLGWLEERTFTEEDRLFLLALGNQAAQALERVRLYQDQVDRERRQSFLAEASRLLAASLDYRTTLDRLARLVVPALADVCSVYVEADDGLELASVAHVDRHLEERMREYAERRALRTASPALLAVYRSGSTIFAPDVPEGAWASSAIDEEQLALLDELALRSSLLVPLIAGGRSIGVIAVSTSTSGRRYGDQDRDTIEDLAGRAAVALDNARSHQARSEVAHTLQQSLLPRIAPAIPYLSIATRYKPLGDSTAIGGDFFDVFSCGDGCWGVVVGDVSGKGVDAASLTALARYTVRAVARTESSPSRALRAVNQAILDQGVGERFCTMTLAFVRPTEASVQLVVASGGHPLPYAIRDGALSTIGRIGTAIGLFDDPDLHDVEAEVHPGTKLVFYTDGYTEARSPSGDFAPALFEDALLRHHGESARSLAFNVEADVLSFEGGRPRDDMALVVLEASGGAGPAEPRIDVRLSPEPASVARARRLLRELLEGDDRAADPSRVQEALIATSELVTNAARAARTNVRLRVWQEDGAIGLEIADDGSGFDVGRFSMMFPPDPEAERGRGLYLVRLLSDDVELRSDDQGTVVRCWLRLHR